MLAAVGHPVGQQPGGGHMLVPVGLHQQDLSNLAAAAAVGTPLTTTLSSATTATPVAPPEPQQPVSVQMYVCVCVQYTRRGSNVCSYKYSGTSDNELPNRENLSVMNLFLHTLQ